MNILRAAILDWAGTTVDWGCQAPVAILREVFQEMDVPLQNGESRTGMGLLKKDQIRTILRLPRVCEAWRRVHGETPGEDAVDKLFDLFVPRQLAILDQHADVIPGAAEAAEMMRSRGMKIGSTTGYTREMLDRILPIAKAQGYAPDASVTPDQVGGGRPFPWMCYENAIQLKVWPMSCCVKVGDTPADMAEGRAAGMWTVGVTLTSNQIGLTRGEWEATPLEERLSLLAKAKSDLERAGADFVIESLSDIESVLEEIEERLLNGQQPALPPLSLLS